MDESCYNEVPSMAYSSLLAAVSLSSIALLTACGGGGGGGGSAGAPPAVAPPADASTRLSYDEISERGTALIAEIDEVDPTPISAMPTRGSATYEGYSAFAYDSSMSDEADVLSQVTLNADFASGGVGGRFHNLQEREVGALDGDIPITEGGITDNVFTGRAVGTVGNDQVGNVDVDLDLLGVFGGDNTEYVSGVVEGGLQSDQGTDGLSGVFGGRAQ